MRRCPVDGAHVAVARDVGPVFGKDALAEWVDLDLPGDVESGALESKIESSDACEQAPDRQHNPAYQTLSRSVSRVSGHKQARITTLAPHCRQPGQPMYPQRARLNGCCCSQLRGAVVKNACQTGNHARQHDGIAD